MRGCLFVLLLGAVALVLVVVVGLPAVASAVIAGGLAGAGLKADDTAVTVSSDPPTDLLGLRADTVHVTATDATFRDLAIGDLDLTLGDVRFLDRTAGSVGGTLRDVTVTDTGAAGVRLDSITLGGTGEAVTASTLVGKAEAERLIADGIERELGVRPARVAISAPDGLAVTALGLTQHGRFLVTPAGDLAVRLTDGPAAGAEFVLLRADSLPVRLDRVRVTDGGSLRLDGELVGSLFG